MMWAPRLAITPITTVVSEGFVIFQAGGQQLAWRNAASEGHFVVLTCRVPTALLPLSPCAHRLR
jgi:hypothetical protein